MTANTTCVMTANTTCVPGQDSEPERKKGIVRIAGKISAFVDCMVVSVPELISRFERWYGDCLCFGEIYNGLLKVMRCYLQLVSKRFRKRPVNSVHIEEKKENQKKYGKMLMRKSG